MSIDDIVVILLDRYSLSDLEFTLGASIEDLSYGLEEFIKDRYDSILSMIKEDELDNREWAN